MEHRILKGISVLFHPLIMPITGVICYFNITPRHLDTNLVKAKVISLFILTVLLPIVIFFLLRTLRKVKTIYLKTTKERILPLMLNTVILVLILLRVITPLDFIELYFFFIGILISTIICLALTFIKFKTSIHMISIGGILMFFIALSLHFSINIVEIISIIFFLVGAIATSRLHLKAHTPKELLIGFVIGFIPQFILIPNWL